MSEKKPVIIYGASGYTGRLIAEFMRDQQIPVIAAGRNKERVEAAMRAAKVEALNSCSVYRLRETFTAFRWSSSGGVPCSRCRK